MFTGQNTKHSYDVFQWTVWLCNISVKYFENLGIRDEEMPIFVTLKMTSLRKKKNTQKNTDTEQDPTSTFLSNTLRLLRQYMANSRQLFAQRSQNVQEDGETFRNKEKHKDKSYHSISIQRLQSLEMVDDKEPVVVSLRGDRVAIHVQDDQVGQLLH